MTSCGTSFLKILKNKLLIRVGRKKNIGARVIEIENDSENDSILGICIMIFIRCFFYS